VEALTEAKSGAALQAAQTKANAVKELAAVSAQAQTDAADILATAEKERQLESFEHEAKQQEAKLGAQRDSKCHTHVLQLAKELRDGRITHIFCFLTTWIRKIPASYLGLGGQHRLRTQTMVRMASSQKQPFSSLIRV
jgi:hypothetical protein